jgi:hypothetical protein
VDLAVAEAFALQKANRERKRLSKEATRSSLDVWDADDGTI